MSKCGNVLCAVVEPGEWIETLLSSDKCVIDLKIGEKKEGRKTETKIEMKGDN